MTQSKDFGGLDLGASTTSVLFFSIILVLVAREQILANRYGVATKGDGPIGSRRADYAWAVVGALSIALVGGGLSVLHTGRTGAQTVADSTIVASPRPGMPAARRPHPTTRLGNLDAFGAIVDDVQAMVAKNDLVGGKTRVKDLEVSWDAAEAGLKPRDPAKWHLLDGQIDEVLSALRAGSPSKADCAAKLATLSATLNRYDGI